MTHEPPENCTERSTVNINVNTTVNATTTHLTPNQTVTCYVVYGQEITPLQRFIASGREFYLACNLNYFAEILSQLETDWLLPHLTIYITRNLRELPEYGEHVVAIVVGDEWCRWPAYSQRVKAVFKCYGTRPTLGFRLCSKPSYLNFLTLIQFLRIHLKRSPGALAYRLSQLWANLRQRPWQSTVFDLPLGYYNQQPLPLKPFWERRCDLYYSGSLVNDPLSKFSPKTWLGLPKMRSRQLMAQALEQFKQRHPDCKIEQDDIPSFIHNPKELVDHPYSRCMMDMRICLVPRGTSIETFRFFEGLRYGCVLITEQLPQRWFYDDAPVLRLNGWDDLEATLLELIANPQRLEQLHQQSLEWWQTKCSEGAIAQFIATQLQLQPLQLEPRQ